MFRFLSKKKTEEPAKATLAEPPSVRTSWLSRLKQGLKASASRLTQVFSFSGAIDDAFYEELEDALLMADAGVQASAYLIQHLRERVAKQKDLTPELLKQELIALLTELLQPLEAPLTVGLEKPDVWMILGVNGAGKTTSIGKLTKHLTNQNQRVLLAAGDTFRAAAREQLSIWADRNHVDIVSSEGADPASVSFDAISRAKAKGHDVVMIDTAGRLPTQLHLMQELEKVKRVIGKAMSEAPHEVLLVIDGSMGQNALSQIKAFDQALGLTGLIMTKLDGTAKGGVLAALALWGQSRTSGTLPVYFIGIGEGLDDLQPFKAQEFAQALLE